MVRDEDIVGWAGGVSGGWRFARGEGRLSVRIGMRDFDNGNNFCHE